MQTFKVAGDLTVEALGPDEAERPLVYIRAKDRPEEDQVVVVFADEIRHLIGALTEAAVYLASASVGEQ